MRRFLSLKSSILTVAATVAVGLSLCSFVLAQQDSADDAENSADLLTAVKAVVSELPADASPKLLSALRQLDRRVATDVSAEAVGLRRQILLALGSSGERLSLGYLHQVFESTPARRDDVARAIARHVFRSKQKRAEDWRLLVRSLTVVEDAAAREVLRALLQFRQRGTKAQWRREVMLLGLKLNDEGGDDAVRLLEYWTGKMIGEPDRPVAQRLAAWQAWYERTYPDLPPAALPVDPPDSKYRYAELLELLRSGAAAGDPRRGATVFEKGLCIKCHRYGKRGEPIGPDLTATAARFQEKEILESIIFPSQRISDQYASQTIVTVDGRSYTGMVGAAGDNIVILPADARKITLAKSDIDRVLPSRKSSMPDGLLNVLTRQEIADLMAYLSRPPR